MNVNDIQTLPPRGYSGAFGIPMPDPDEWCELCGKRYGSPQRCTTDGANHGHGMIHAFTADLRLKWVCGECAASDAAHLDADKQRRASK